MAHQSDGRPPRHPAEDFRQDAAAAAAAHQHHAEPPQLLGGEAEVDQARARQGAAGSDVSPAYTPSEGTASERQAHCGAPSAAPSTEVVTHIAPGVQQGLPPSEGVQVTINGIAAFRVPFGGEMSVLLTPSLRVNGDGTALYAHCIACSQMRQLKEALQERGGEAAAVRVVLSFRGTDPAERRDVVLGYLSQQMRHCAVRDFIPFLPTCVTARCLFHAAVGDADEERFKRGMVHLFTNRIINPHGGSMPSALLQNHARELPLYEAVIGEKYAGQWHRFLRAHPAEYHVFQMTTDDIAREGLHPFISPREVRVALLGDDGPAGILALDHVGAQALREREARMLATLRGALENQPEGVDQRELLDKLCDEPSFLQFLRPSFSTLARFLTIHKHRFVWSQRPGMPPTVGLARGDRRRAGSLGLSSSHVGGGSTRGDERSQAGTSGTAPGGAHTSPQRTGRR
eukprot:TRINITY_DN51633_c0_g1_i1.p1 TRINITY_DN51633_c0_g1~~TRINITY_DN51633_c0_g1_i1.p1  ORF type:complete len:490 (+),score=148.92 TRINITY_DN51633_c0_g1_i1:98-1471(+)